jgi:hypothetical protein
MVTRTTPDHAGGWVLVAGAAAIQASAAAVLGGRLTVPLSLLIAGIGFAVTACGGLIASHSAGGSGVRMGLRDVLLANGSTAAAFVSFYLALAFVPGSIATGIEFSIAPIAAWLMSRDPTKRFADVVVLVLLAGNGLGFAWIRLDSALPTLSWAVGVALSVVAGCGAAAVAEQSNGLAAQGVGPAQILATRFHLTYLIALPVAVLVAPESGLNAPQGLLIVGLAGIVLPLYLIQRGLANVPAVLAMTIFAAIPPATYLLELITARALFDVVAIVLAVTTSLLALAAHRMRASAHQRAQPPMLTRQPRDRDPKP